MPKLVLAGYPLQEEIHNPLMMSLWPCEQGLLLCFPDFLLFLLFLLFPTQPLFKLSLSSSVVYSLTDDDDVKGERPA